jgi:hypothetical protein
MSTDLCIRYKDSAREEFSYPFSGYHTLRDYWRPIAERRDLTLLQQVENLFITGLADAEQLLRELRFVENLLQSADQHEVPLTKAHDMLETLSIMLPAIDRAIAEWENVMELSV